MARIQNSIYFEMPTCLTCGDQDKKAVIRLTENVHEWCPCKQNNINLALDVAEKEEARVLKYH